MEYPVQKTLYASSVRLECITTPRPTSARLARWAFLLEEYNADVALLHLVEYLPTTDRYSIRHDDSPLSIAYRDPVLRAQGLEGQTYGDALRFFRLSEWRMHRILCSCFYSCRRVVPSREVARQVHKARRGARCVESVAMFLGVGPSTARTAVRVLV